MSNPKRLQVLGKFGGSVDIKNTAKPGQMLLVKSVDENGKPTEWETVDRTHGMTVATIFENTIFDGNIEGRETIQIDDGLYFVKVSDRILSVEDLVGSTVVAVQNGSKQDIILTSDIVSDASADMGIPAIMAGEYVVSAYEAASFSDISFTTGTWYICAPGAFWVESVSCLPSGDVVKETVEKLDNKYLDMGWIPTATPVYKEVVPETVIDESPKTVSATIPADISLAMEFRVTVDGEQYHGTFYEYQGFALLGNMSLMIEDYPDNGQPFLILLWGDASLRVLMAETGKTLKVDYKDLEYNVIPDQYLPTIEAEVPLPYEMPTMWNTSIGAVDSWSVNAEEIKSASETLQAGKSVAATIDHRKVNVIGANYTGSENYNYAIAAGFEGVYRVTDSLGKYHKIAMMALIPPYSGPDEDNNPRPYYYAVPNPRKAEVGHVLRVKTVMEPWNGDSAQVLPNSYEAVDPEELLVLTSPNGTQYKLSVADDGTLSTKAVTT